MPLANTASSRVICALATAFSVSACLFPSFDGLGGRRADDDPSTSDAAAAASVRPAHEDAGSAATPTEASPSGDASLDAVTPKREFQCGSIRCDLHDEVCCDHDLAPAECKPSGSPGTCDGITRCGDSSECGADEECCYVTSTRTGSCTKGCSDLVVCDLDHPTCPSGKACNGRWWSLPYCI